MLSNWKTDSNSSVGSGSALDELAGRTTAKGGVAPPPIKAGSTTSDKTHSVVDASLTMRGDLESEGDILVKGKVIGNIRCKLLVVDTDAIIEGGVDADEAVIRGRVSGEVRATRIRLEKSANVDANLYQSSFSADEGARIRGSLNSLEDSAVRKEAKAAEAKPAAVPPAIVPVASAG